MFLAFLSLVIIVTVPLLGGDLLRITELRLRRSWTLFAALAVQIAITSAPHAAPVAVLAGLHVFSYALAAVFVWVNRRVAGLPVLAAGALSNLVTIGLNHGELPASRSALIAAGQPLGSGFANSGVIHHPHLAFLGDVVATPAWLPFRNVISVGDVLILVGAAWLVWAACGLPRAARVIRRLRGPQAEPVVGRHRMLPASRSNPSSIAT